MALKGEENVEARGEIVRGLESLADAERRIAAVRNPEKRFRHVAALADTDEPGNEAASEVIEALHP